MKRLKQENTYSDNFLIKKGIKTEKHDNKIIIFFKFHIHMHEYLL